MTNRSAAKAIDFCSFETDTPNRHAVAHLLASPNMFMALLSAQRPQQGGALIVDEAWAIMPEPQPSVADLLGQRPPRIDDCLTTAPMDVMGPVGGQKVFDQALFLAAHPNTVIIDPKADSW